MPVSSINGIRLYWEQRGERGPSVVFVHGSWGDHHNWDLVVPALAGSFRVFTYDRRGHSQSERPPGQGTLDQDVEDLAALIRGNGLAPAHVIGNSAGAMLTLKTAAAHPELFASAVAHEPPLFAMIHDHPMLPAARERVAAVVQRLRAGDMESGAKLFVETIAFGPGMWDQLPPETRRTFVFNAPTWLDEVNEGERVMAVDVDRLATFGRPMLLSQGDQSAPFFPAIVDKLLGSLPAAQGHVFRGAGHVPHLTMPDEYVRVVSSFLNGVASAGQVELR
jgi:pimeloyl-ACP methyl ester carboxylesterase